MPLHWTYSDFSASDDLLQGDIISRTAELVAVLSEVFPYFCDERYTAFLVTTQSCDLVRRGTNPCKAKYVSLAVIRELGPLLPEILDEVCGSGFPGIYRKESRYLAEQLLVRIINQNEQARGVFYLHQDAEVGIGTPSVALLRVTFALRQQHYELLMRARSGRLQGEYANKLGWLAGNLFSRVATPDWEDQEHDVGASRKQAKQLLRFVTEVNDQNWVSEEWIKEAQRKSVNLAELDPKTAYSQLEEHAPPEPIEVMLQRMEGIGRELLAERELTLALRQSEEFLLAFSENILRAVSKLSDTERQHVAPLLVSDEGYCAAVCRSVSSEAKKQFKTHSSQPVEMFLEALSKKYGTIWPVLDRLRQAMTSLDQAKLSSLEEDMRTAKFFDDAVLEHVRAIVEAIVNEHAERQRELASRLRRDARVKTAFRRLTNTRAEVID
jgi:hypothetical protein